MKFIHMRKPRRNFVTDDQILSAYSETNSANEVEKRLDCPKTTIYRVLKKHRVVANGLEEYRSEARIFSSEIEREILEKYESGSLIKDLVKEYGGSYHSIKASVLRSGGSLKFGRGTRVSDDEMARIFDLYSKGFSKAKISRVMDRSQAFVGRIINNGGRNYKVRLQKDYSEDPAAVTIKELYESGMSLRDIGKKIGRPQQYAYRILKRLGVELRKWQASGEDHSQWIGGRLRSVGGYYRIWIPQDDPMSSMRNHHGYVLEHRLVLARKLGRPLSPKETVHHIDGDRGNNSEDNLQLFHGKHGAGVVMNCNECGSHNIGPAKLAQPI